MASRIAIALGGLVASLTLAVGLAAAGLAPPTVEPVARLAGTADVPVVDRAATGSAGGGEELASTEPEVVYVRPAPSPRTIVRTVTDGREGDPDGTEVVRSLRRDDDEDGEDDDDRDDRRRRDGRDDRSNDSGGSDG